MTDHAQTRILLGVTGGIAAYKSADLVRRLRDANCSVQVVMTEGATQFITPLTLQALSGQTVRQSLWDLNAEAAMGHIELARWADRIVIAPASADFIARLAHGMANDLLTTLCLASEAPITLAPAMNRLMWANAATQSNVALLKQRGVEVIGPSEGVQACGETGAGRMLEPSEIVSAILFNHNVHDQRSEAIKKLRGKHLVVSAGPTFEDIDPVRFIGNRSSGRMGFAIAEAARDVGMRVTLIAGPVHLPTPAHVTRVDVRSARAMHEAVLSACATADVYVGAAAVADFRPAQVLDQKHKKHNKDAIWSIDLVQNPDIIQAVAALKPKPLVVGFAAETENLAEYATSKLQKKNLDLILANDVSNNQGFDRDDNALQAFWNGGQRVFAAQTKRALAEAIVNLLAERIAPRSE